MLLISRCRHAHIRTHTHTNTHAHTHTHTYTHTCTHTHTRSLSLSHTYTYTCTYTYPHTYTYTQRTHIPIDSWVLVMSVCRSAASLATEKPHAGLSLSPWKRRSIVTTRHVWASSATLSAKYLEEPDQP